HNVRSQIGVRMPEWLIEEIDQYRGQLKPIPTRPMAVISLIREGLDADRAQREKRHRDFEASQKRLRTREANKR
ncbi:MAG: hypothetical protein AB7O04_01635, partial [Hyphomonadaceae bacterium]